MSTLHLPAGSYIEMTIYNVFNHVASWTKYVSAPRVECLSVDMGVAQNACCVGDSIDRHVNNIKSEIITTVPRWKLDKTTSKIAMNVQGPMYYILQY